MPADPRVQHLLRRAGFGATSAEAAAHSQRGFSATLESLVDYHRTPDDVDALIGQPGYSAVVPSAGGMEPFSPASTINDARQRWLFRMVHGRRPLQEKMALFWHQHFATAYSKIANAVGGPGATQMMAAKGSNIRPGCGDRSSCSATTRCRISATFSSKSRETRRCSTGWTVASTRKRGPRKTSRAK